MKKFIDKNCFWHDEKDKARVESELEDLIKAETERCAKIAETKFCGVFIPQEIAKAIRSNNENKSEN